MLVSKVMAKGQTTLPREVRVRLGIELGDRIAYEIDEGGEAGGEAGVRIRKVRLGGVEATLAADWLSREDREDFHEL
jgi:bifunctional DNA-binding transcriptional regulator/antitoxin component of YhaV-PrlF toxin-antitoxin module